MSQKLLVRKLNSEAQLPTLGSAGAVGYDLYSVSSGVVPANSWALIKTGISIQFPEFPNKKFYGRVASRSGLSLKKGLEVGAGIIDPDYRGELGVILYNHSQHDFIYEKNYRVAQLIISEYFTPEVAEVTELSSTYRGEGGFGSTGI